MRNKPPVTIRKSIESDGSYFIEWLKEEGVLGGFPMINDREIEDAVRIWMLYVKRGTSITALCNDKPCGSACLYISEIDKLKHQALFVIIVTEKMRGKGIGTLLLNEISRLGVEEYGLEILHLEVYEDNPAYHLYKRSGFEEYGKHPKYLKDEKGNYSAKALMQKEL